MRHQQGIFLGPAVPLRQRLVRSGAMEFLPDYGLRLRNDGLGQTPCYFYAFVFYNIMVLGGGLFRTSVEMPYGDELHLLSVDFTTEQLRAVLSRAPADARESIARDLTQDAEPGRIIELSDGIHCGIRAAAGEVLHGSDEDYVPLVIQEFLK